MTYAKVILTLAVILNTLHSYAQLTPPQPAVYTQKMSASPLLFMENKGQVADAKGSVQSDVLFTATSGGAKLYLTSNGIHYQFTKTEYPKGYKPQSSKEPQDPQKELEMQKQTKTSTHRFTLQLQGANIDPVIKKEKASSYTENYYLAQCLNGITGVRSYEKIVYQNVYPNIDWVLYSKGGFMEYDFLVHPGGNPSVIRLKIQDADNVAITPQGDLLIKTSLGEVKEKEPVSFADGKQVSSRFIQNEDGSIGFEVAECKGKELRIDPSVEWGTYYGGTLDDSGEHCSVDADGNVYLSGETFGNPNMADGGFQNTFGGGITDAFLVKFSSSGVRLWATYYGGEGYDANESSTVDKNGNVYLCGQTTSTVNIASNGFQNTAGGNGDAYLIKINSNGSRIWATYYGGSQSDRGTSCKTDNNGNVYLAGYTESTTDIATGGFQNIFGGENDAFLVKFNTDGNRIWATYYGGLKSDEAWDCCIDKDNNVYVTGFSVSAEGIAFNGFQNEWYDHMDAFLVKFNSDGGRLWGTYYGGEWSDAGFSCLTDGDFVYMAGQTASDKNIAFNGFQNIRGGSDDAFLAKFTSSGTRVWATYFGSEDTDAAYSIALADGNIYLAGEVKGANTNISFNGIQNTYSGGFYDVLLAKFNSDGNRLWASYIGGSGADVSWGCATNGHEGLFLSGVGGANLNIALNGFQTANAGGQDAFLIKISDPSLPLHLLSFTAYKQPTTVALQWRTTNEQNTSNFVVQRSTSSDRFATIGKVAAKGSSQSINNYNYTDNSPFTNHETRYYRLQMLDKDGKYSYSNIEKIAIDNSVFNISPNPAKGNATLQLDGFAKGNYALKLYDAAGKQVYEKILALGNGAYTETILLGQLAAGVYKVSIANQVRNLVVE